MVVGEGTKVCVEIVVMAADAGLIPVDEDVIAVAGTGRGADTALVVKPANSSTFFNLKMRETIAEPKSFRKNSSRPGTGLKLGLNSRK